MTPKKNVAASVRARLLNYSRAEREAFDYVLTRYGIERLLYRLSQSEEADRFVLKGALLFTLWTDVKHRATRDVDLSSTGEPELEDLVEVFRTVCRTPVEDDGVLFDPETVRAARIRETEAYQGVRVRLRGYLGRARIDLQVDVGFGDAISPGPVPIRLPTLLDDQPAPALASYPRESLIAEKLHIMVTLGRANSRMKDFFDIAFLGRHFEFEGATLAAAVRATFERRRTELPPEPPTVFTDTFIGDAGKQAEWRAFRRKSGLGGDEALAVVMARVQAFTWPVIEAAREGSALGRWLPGTGWS